MKINGQLITGNLLELLKGDFRCPKYIESIYDIIDYLVWLRLHGYTGGYGEDSMDEDENGIPIAYQTNAMYDCVMDVYYPDDEDRYHETQGEDIIGALDDWVNRLFDE
jgi:hypothetical protein